MLDRIAGRVWLLLRASIIVTLAAGPIIAFHYGLVPLLAPLSALLLAPAVPAAIVLALIAFAFSLLPVVQAGILHVLVAPLADWITFVAHLLGGPAWAAVSVPPFNAYWLMPYYAGSLLLFDWTRRHR